MLEGSLEFSAETSSSLRTEPKTGLFSRPPESISPMYGPLSRAAAAPAAAAAAAAAAAIEFLKLMLFLESSVELALMFERRVASASLVLTVSTVLAVEETMSTLFPQEVINEGVFLVPTDLFAVVRWLEQGRSDNFEDIVSIFPEMVRPKWPEGKTGYRIKNVDLCKCQGGCLCSVRSASFVSSFPTNLQP